MKLTAEKLTENLRQTAELTEKLLANEREAAAMLSLSPRTVWSLADDGKIPYVRIGRRKLYSVESLRAWIREQETTAKAQAAVLI